MAIEFNHTIVHVRDSAASAEFLAGMLGLPAPKKWGPFHIVTTDNGANIDFMDADGEIATQHYAFLVGESEFDATFARIKERKLTYWADPGQTKKGEINRRDGGRGLYFATPTATCWRSSPAPTAAAAGTLEPAVAIHETLAIPRSPDPLPARLRAPSSPPPAERAFWSIVIRYAERRLQA